MRKQTRLLSAAIVSLAGVVAACNADSLTESNVSPNAPGQTTPYLLFPQAVSSFMSVIRNSSFEHGFEANWVQHYAEVNYVEADVYNPRSSTVQTFWNSLWAGPLQDVRYLLGNAKDAATGGIDKKLVAPALTTRGYMFQEMTDLWGDIPFTEAGQGDPAGTGLTPKYDTQKTIYDSLFAAYKTAKAMYAAPGSTGGYGKSDPVYAGDLTKWNGLNNSLHARAALQLSKRDPAKAQAELAIALAGPVITTNANNAKLVYPGDGVNNNPLYTNWRTRDDQRVSKAFIDTLKAKADPRLTRYAARTPSSPATAPVYAGAPNGVGVQLGAGPVTSRPNASIRSITSPSFMMTASEVYLIRAEAAARGWVAGDAQALFQQGIRASMEQWGVTEPEIVAYLARPENVLSTTLATALRQIALEKWISLFNLETRAYAEWRRTGYPVLTPGPKSLFNTVPRRLPYPPIEESLNNANVTAAMAAQGGGAITNRVWWDQ